MTELEELTIGATKIHSNTFELNYKYISNLNPIPENKWTEGAMYLAITTEYEGHDGGVLIYGELTGDYDSEPLVRTSQCSSDSLGLFCTLIAEMPILNDVNLIPSATN